MFLRFKLGDSVINSLEEWQNLIKTAANLSELKETVRGYRHLFFAAGDFHSSDFYNRRHQEVCIEISRRSELAKRAA